MSLSIALNSKQLENLSKESLKLKTNYAVKGIDLFINSQDLNSENAVQKRRYE